MNFYSALVYLCIILSAEQDIRSINKPLLLNAEGLNFSNNFRSTSLVRQQEARIIIAILQLTKFNSEEKHYMHHKCVNTCYNQYQPIDPSPNIDKICPINRTFEKKDNYEMVIVKTKKKLIDIMLQNKYKQNNISFLYQDAINNIFLYDSEIKEDTRSYYYTFKNMYFDPLTLEQYHKFLKFRLKLEKIYNNSNRFAYIVFILYAILNKSDDQKKCKELFLEYDFNIEFFLHKLYELFTSVLKTNSEYNLKILKKISKLVKNCRDEYDVATDFAHKTKFYLKNIKLIFDFYFIYNIIFDNLSIENENAYGEVESSLITYPFDALNIRFNNINYKEILNIRLNEKKLSFDHPKQLFLKKQKAWFGYMYSIYALDFVSSAEDLRLKCTFFVEKLFECQNYSFVRDILGIIFKK